MRYEAALLLFSGMIFLASGNVLGEGKGKMKLSSSAFENNQSIPARFTCDGKDINPPLAVENIPPGAKSLALIVDDPDAPRGTWVHWVVYDIPIVFRIEEHSVPGKLGANDSGGNNYGGPCPPSGTHRYFFKLYALDKTLDAAEGISKQELERMMQGHILEKSELVGLYKRTK